MDTPRISSWRGDSGDTCLSSLRISTTRCIAIALESACEKGDTGMARSILAHALEYDSSYSVDDARHIFSAMSHAHMRRTLREIIAGALESIDAPVRRMATSILLALIIAGSDAHDDDSLHAIVRDDVSPREIASNISAFINGVLSRRNAKKAADEIASTMHSEDDLIYILPLSTADRKHRENFRNGLAELLFGSIDVSGTRAPCETARNKASIIAATLRRVLTKSSEFLAKSVHGTASYSTALRDAALHDTVLREPSIAVMDHDAEMSEMALIDHIVALGDMATSLCLSVLLADPIAERAEVACEKDE